MSKKISDYFKVEEKQSLTEEISSKLAEIRECRVILQDIIKESKNTEFKKGSSQIEKADNSIKNCLKKQEKTKTSSQVECKLCDKIMLKTSIIRHIKIFHAMELKNSAFYCEICHQSFLTFKSFKTHTNIKHSKVSLSLQTEKFECDLDGKLFGMKRHLNQHMKIHLPKVKCKICNKTVKILSLKCHMNQTHATESKFQCKICLKLFKSKQLLKNHGNTHDKQFQCDICISKFRSQYQLDKHTINIHEKPRSFECETCGNKFNTKDNLKKHQKTHDKYRLKSFKCQRCDFTADFKNNLRNHQKFHENMDKKIATMKNHQKCDKCQRICKDKPALKLHIKIAHPKNLCQCDLCGKYLKVKSSVTRHINFHLRTLSKSVEFDK